MLINLSDDTVEPVPYVLVSKLHLLANLNGFVIELLGRLDLDMKLVNFGIRSFAHRLQSSRRVCSAVYASLVI